MGFYHVPHTPPHWLRYNLYLGILFIIFSS